MTAVRYIVIVLPNLTAVRNFLDCYETKCKKGNGLPSVRSRTIASK